MRIFPVRPAIWMRGHDGRTWDFTDRGEGLRNTTDLRGRAGTGHGRVHWSANFDEIQDFENDIRTHFGGLGFLSDQDFATTQDPLGSPKAGLSQELDDLKAYVESLQRAPDSPHRQADGTMTSLAEQGELVFRRLDCASCHAGQAFTDSTLNASRLHDVGTLTPGSGQRLGAGALAGVDAPTLRGLWDSAPYFHDGSAATLQAVLERSTDAHGGMKDITPSEKEQLIAYLLQLDEQNGDSPVNRPPVITEVRMEPEQVTGTTSQLTVTAHDPDEEPVKFLWQASGAHAVTLGNAQSSQTQVTFQATGAYRFDVQVQDPRGNQTQSHTSGNVVPTATTIEIHSQPLEPR